MNTKFTDLTTRTITALIFGAIFCGVFLFFPPWCFSVLLSAIAVFILVVEWPALPSWSWFITPLYPVLPFVLLIYLNHQYHQLLYYLFAMVFAHDIGAYLIGSRWGKTKIAPRISPQKSWEGALGGLLFAAAALFLLLLFFQRPCAHFWCIILAPAVALTATVGDFFESWLKRQARIKNSGTLLPGHGGLLDRFDSILSTTFLFFLLRCHLAAFFT